MAAFAARAPGADCCGAEPVRQAAGRTRAPSAVARRANVGRKVIPGQDDGPVEPLVGAVQQAPARLRLHQRRRLVGRIAAGCARACSVIMPEVVRVGMAGRVAQCYFRNDSVPLCSYDAEKRGSSGAVAMTAALPASHARAADRGAFRVAARTVH